MTEVRVRFAPSPTGPLHVGGVRTALYNYLLAKQKQGKFILRIEDTDSQRFVEGAEEYIKDTFKWLGLEFDEGPHVGGPYGPYKQSERKEIYKEHIDILLGSGKAYIAFDTPEELEAARQNTPNFQYDASTRGTMRNSLTIPTDQVNKLIEANHPYVVRFKVEPNIEVQVKDSIRGIVTINSSILDDKVLYKSADQLPTYHLANIVDDHLMKITQVIRGEEWLPSAPLHILLYKAFGWEDTMPQFAHLPLLLNPSGKGKLSKRDGDKLGFPVFPLEWIDPKTKAMSTGFREQGFLPQAIINFLALLGWNPGTDQEILSKEELIKLFDLERCSKSGAKFDYEKGKWFNHQYIMQEDLQTLAIMLNKDLQQRNITKPLDEVVKVVELIRERVNLLPELWDQSFFFFETPATYDPKVVKKRWNEKTPEQMMQLANLLEGLKDFSSQNQEIVVKQWIADNEYNMGGIMNAFRLAIVGQSMGPHLFDITAIIGKKETIQRIHKAIEILG